MSAKIITTTNGKGGTGKTTINAYLAEMLFKYGKKILIIDLDPNCSISEMYGKELQENTSKNFLSGKKQEPYIIKQKPEAELAILPSDLDMSMLANIMDTQLKIQLRKSGWLESYDYIILDPPGSWNAQTRNTVFASDIIIISGTCSKLDLRATKNYFAQLENCYLDAEIFVLCNKYNTKTNPENIWEEYQKEFKEYLIEFPIPDIKSLKYLTANPDYPLHQSVQARLKKYVDIVTGINWEQGAENA